MNKKKSIILNLIIFIFVFCLMIPTEVKASADSYTDAKTFFETCSDKKYHVEFADMDIYYATKAKSASSSKSLRYQTIGWQIRLEANGQSISVDVKRGGSYLQEVNEEYSTDGYCYSLYKINYNQLCDLASKKNPTAWNSMKTASTIYVYMDAILSWKNSGSSTPAGDIISENGYGSVTFNDASKVWYMGNEADRNVALSKFNTKFEGYYGLERPVKNNTLNITYNAGYTDVTSTAGYKIDPLTGQISKDNIFSVERVYGVKRFEVSSLKAPVDEFGLRKTGYRIVPGKEWKTADSTKYFNTASTYATTDINVAAATQSSSSIEFVANWEPIQYQVMYHGNGMIGSAISVSATYDTPFKTITNPFYSQNYNFKGWNTRADGSGIYYGENETVSNLTDVHGDTVTLYAQWEPKTYTISIDQGVGSGGTTTFYNKYNTGFYLSKDSTEATTTIVLPDTPAGYEFNGIYISKNSKNEQIVNKNGEILVSNTFFNTDMTLYTHWDLKTYTITFDQQGGTNGTNKYVATYTKELPNDLTKPYKTGYTFAGYYTQPNGGGEQWFNEYMNSSKTYDITNDITLYAYWIDEELPTARLEMPTYWTNNPSGVHVEGIAEDKGSGLLSALLNREDEFGDVFAGGSSSLGGTSDYTIAHNNTKEGIYRYRLDVKDIANADRLVTVYKISKYDKKAPTGSIVSGSTNITNMKYISIFADVTDFNVD